MNKFIIPGNPVPKPRQSQRDKWKPRPCVLRYRAYADKLREHVGIVECTGIVNWVAYFGMAKSWSKKKKLEHIGEPHQQKPDRDNIDKGILDALFPDDSHVWSGSMQKYWDDGNGPRLELWIK